MRPKEKTRPRGGAGRASELICLAAIDLENSPATHVVQAAISVRPPSAKMLAVLRRDALAEAALIAARAGASIAVCASGSSLPALESALRALRAATVEALNQFRALERDEMGGACK
jgi:hypothetical protein